MGRGCIVASTFQNLQVFCLIRAGRREQSANYKTGHKLWTYIQMPQRECSTASFILTAPSFFQEPVTLYNSDSFPSIAQPSRNMPFPEYPGGVRKRGQGGRVVLSDDQYSDFSLISRFRTKDLSVFPPLSLAFSQTLWFLFYIVNLSWL